MAQTPGFHRHSGSPLKLSLGRPPKMSEGSIGGRSPPSVSATFFTGQGRARLS